MRNWFKLRPTLVMVMLFVAPATAITHFLLGWAPEAFAVKGLSSNVHRDAQQIERCRVDLQRTLGDTAQLRTLAGRSLDPQQAPWLPQREHNRVSDTLARTLQGDGATVVRLAFGEAALYAAVPGTGLLACEQVTVTCRGPYAALTRRLDRLADLDLPLRLTHVAWRRGEQDVEVTLKLQAPFMPGPALAADLREAAGWSEEDDL